MVKAGTSQNSQFLCIRDWATFKPQTYPFVSVMEEVICILHLDWHLTSLIGFYNQ